MTVKLLQLKLTQAVFFTETRLFILGEKIYV